MLGRKVGKANMMVPFGPIGAVASVVISDLAQESHGLIVGFSEFDVLRCTTFLVRLDLPSLRRAYPSHPSRATCRHWVCCFRRYVHFFHESKNPPRTNQVYTESDEEERRGKEEKRREGGKTHNAAPICPSHIDQTIGVLRIKQLAHPLEHLLRHGHGDRQLHGVCIRASRRPTRSARRATGPR